MSEQLDLRTEALSEDIFRDLMKKLRILQKDGARADSVAAKLREYAAWLEEINNEVR